MKKVKPYGSWKTPVSAEKVASGTVGLSEIQLTEESVYWLASRPSQNGRTFLVRLDKQGGQNDLTPEEFNVRSRVHEYGGGSYVVNKGDVYFTNFDDQRVYRLRPGGSPRPISPKGNYRYADFSFDENRQLLWAVCEDHSTGDREAENYLVSLDPTKPGKHKVAVRGHDFYSSPRLSPRGDKMAWVTWDHPNMPWDATSLHLASLSEDGRVTKSKVVAGSRSESVVQPKWSPNGYLYFISDRNNWWNLYRWTGETTEAVVEKEAELGQPHWKFGISTYDFTSGSDLIFSYTEDGRWFLSRKETGGGDIETSQVPYTQISSVNAAGDEVWFIGGSPESPPGIRRYRWSTETSDTLALSASIDLGRDYMSTPRPLTYYSENGEKVHAFYYPPYNKQFEGPKDEKPPLLVISHGGPTSATDDNLSYGIQFWTTRGIAVLDVNYRGSTGFGRDYREKLKGEWGIVDVEDCVNGALNMVEEGEVDGDKLIIRGGSAGGYTTLAALTFREVFDAGASYYGVSDPAALARETHKFESRYLEGLIGPYPEQEEIYEQRSPLNHSEKLSCPVIFFQGKEDRVVPPNQAKEMYQSLEKRDIPTAYLAFEGEQHGFRQEENIRRALEAELSFYSNIFRFPLREDIREVNISNLD